MRILVKKPIAALRELALVAGGKTFGLISLFVCGVLAARATGPEEYSIYAAALALTLLIDAMIGSPLDWAMVRFGTLHRDEPERVEQVLGATFRLKLYAAIVTISLALIFKDKLNLWLFPGNQNSNLITIIFLSSTGLLALRGTAAYLQLQLRFKTYAILDTTTAFMRLLIVSLLLYLGFQTAIPYVTVYGLSALAAFVVGLFIVKQGYMWAKRPHRKDQHALLHFFGATSIIIILGTITGRADILLLSAFSPGESAGHYAAAAHVAVLATLLASYAGVIAQPRVINFVKQGRLWELMRWNIIGGLGLSLLAVPIALWLLPWLVPLLFGEAFSPSVSILQILIIGTCIDLFTMPVLQTFGIQLCSKPTLIGEIIVTLFFIALAPVAAESGPIAMAWLVTVVRLLKLGFYSAIALRYGNNWHKLAAVAVTRNSNI